MLERGLKAYVDGTKSFIMKFCVMCSQKFLNYWFQVVQYGRPVALMFCFKRNQIVLLLTNITELRHSGYSFTENPGIHGACNKCCNEERYSNYEKLLADV